MKILWSLSKLFPWLLKEVVYETADGFEKIFLLICKFGNREVADTVPIFKNGGKKTPRHLYVS